MHDNHYFKPSVVLENILCSSYNPNVEWKCVAQKDYHVFCHHLCNNGPPQKKEFDPGSYKNCPSFMKALKVYNIILNIHSIGYVHHESDWHVVPVHVLHFILSFEYVIF
jgi:hypothetical protein